MTDLCVLFCDEVIIEDTPTLRLYYFGEWVACNLELVESFMLLCIAGKFRQATELASKIVDGAIPFSLPDKYELYVAQKLQRTPPYNSSASSHSATTPHVHDVLIRTLCMQEDRFDLLFSVEVLLYLAEIYRTMPSYLILKKCNVLGAFATSLVQSLLPDPAGEQRFALDEFCIELAHLSVREPTIERTRELKELLSKLEEFERTQLVLAKLHNFQVYSSNQRVWLNPEKEDHQPYGVARGLCVVMPVPDGEHDSYSVVTCKGKHITCDSGDLLPRADSVSWKRMHVETQFLIVQVLKDMNDEKECINALRRINFHLNKESLLIDFMMYMVAYSDMVYAWISNSQMVLAECTTTGEKKVKSATDFAGLALQGLCKFDVFAETSFSRAYLFLLQFEAQLIMIDGWIRQEEYTKAWDDIRNVSKQPTHVPSQKCAIVRQMLTQLRVHQFMQAIQLVLELIPTTQLHSVDEKREQIEYAWKCTIELKRTLQHSPSNRVEQWYRSIHGRMVDIKKFLDESRQRLATVQRTLKDKNGKLEQAIVTLNMTSMALSKTEQAAQELRQKLEASEQANKELNAQYLEVQKKLVVNAVLYQELKKLRGQYDDALRKLQDTCIQNKSLVEEHIDATRKQKHNYDKALAELSEKGKQLNAERVNGLALQNELETERGKSLALETELENERDSNKRLEMEMKNMEASHALKSLERGRVHKAFAELHSVMLSHGLCEPPLLTQLECPQCFEPMQVRASSPCVLARARTASGGPADTLPCAGRRQSRQIRLRVWVRAWHVQELLANPHALPTLPKARGHAHQALCVARGGCPGPAARATSIAARCR